MLMTMAMFNLLLLLAMTWLQGEIYVDVETIICDCIKFNANHKTCFNQIVGFTNFAQGTQHNIFVI